MAFGMSGRVFHAPFLHTSDDFKLKAVVERNQKKAKDLYPDILSYDSVDELLADVHANVQVVVSDVETGAFRPQGAPRWCARCRARKISTHRITAPS